MWQVCASLWGVFFGMFDSSNVQCQKAMIKVVLFCILPQLHFLLWNTDYVRLLRGNHQCIWKGSKCTWKKFRTAPDNLLHWFKHNQVSNEVLIAHPYVVREVPDLLCTFGLTVCYMHHYYLACPILMGIQRRKLNWTEPPGENGLTMVFSTRPLRRLMWMQKGYREEGRVPWCFWSFLPKTLVEVLKADNRAGWTLYQIEENLLPESKMKSWCVS